MFGFVHLISVTIRVQKPAVQDILRGAALVQQALGATSHSEVAVPARRLEVTGGGGTSQCCFFVDVLVPLGFSACEVPAHG